MKKTSYTLIAIALGLSILVACHPDSESYYGQGQAIEIGTLPEPIAVAAEPAERLGTVPAVEAPETTTTVEEYKGPYSGDCASWMLEFARHGATEAELAFFFTGSQDNKGIIWRETRCGTNMVNPRTSDRGICQTNGVHAEAGYFGGRYFGDGGWLLALTGIRHPTRLSEGTDPSSTQWTDACLILYRVCGPGPWRSGAYGCTGRSLDSLGY